MLTGLNDSSVIEIRILTNFSKFPGDFAVTPLPTFPQTPAAACFAVLHTPSLKFPPKFPAPPEQNLNISIYAPAPPPPPLSALNVQ
jgi:hypothetical protein